MCLPCESICPLSARSRSIFRLFPRRVEGLSPGKRTSSQPGTFKKISLVHAADMFLAVGRPQSRAQLASRNRVSTIRGLVAQRCRGALAVRALTLSELRPLVHGRAFRVSGPPRPPARNPQADKRPSDGAPRRSRERSLCVAACPRVTAEPLPGWISAVAAHQGAPRLIRRHRTHNASSVRRVSTSTACPRDLDGRGTALHRSSPSVHDRRAMCLG